MNVRLGLLILVFLGFQCQDNTYVPPPKNLIPEQSMIDILVDLSLMETLEKSSRGKLINDYKFSMEYIYQKYAIDSLQLALSRGYYAQHPKEYLQIHKASEYILERMVDSLNRLKREERKKKDD